MNRKFDVFIFKIVFLSTSVEKIDVSNVKQDDSIFHFISEKLYLEHF